MSTSRSIARRATLATCCLALLALGGCAAQDPLLLNQPLAWTPTNSLDLGIAQGQGSPATVRFETFTDTAANPQLIGRNVEQTPARPVTTSAAVGPFVTQHLQQLFAQAGYSPGGATADRVISGEVSHFFVSESNTYQGSVILHVKVADESGKVLWQGTVDGTNETFGRSYHIDNYQQVLSDSLIDAANKLLKSPALRACLTMSH